MQYTIHDIPEEVDLTVRERAQREDLSLNQVLVRALRFAFGKETAPTAQRDLSDIAAVFH